MTPDYMQSRQLPVDLLLLFEGLKGRQPHSSELKAAVDIIKDLTSALRWAQGEVITLRHERDNLKLENAFLTRLTQED